MYHHPVINLSEIYADATAPVPQFIIPCPAVRMNQLAKCRVHDKRLDPRALLRELSSLDVKLISCFANAAFWTSFLSVVLDIPLVTIEPADKVETVLAAIILQISVNELCFHCAIQLRIPATFYLDDNRYRVVIFPV